MPKLRRIDLEDREGIRRELLRFVEELKEKLPVSQVYLFGSFARGKRGTRAGWESLHPERA